MKKEEKKRFDYRHIVSIFITLGFVAIGIFVFPNAFARLAEALRDLVLSFAYFFNEAFGLGYDINVTVTELPSWQITDSKYHPLTLLPFTWEEFQSAWNLYWQLFISETTFHGYLAFLGDVAYYLSQILMFVVPFVYIFGGIFNGYINTHNNDTDKESKPVKVFKILSNYSYRPIKKWITGYIDFLKEHFKYVKMWLFSWALYFNVITIIIEFISFYYYFLFSYDFVEIYRQVYKFMLDLTTVVRFVPAILWAFGTLGVLEYWARRAGYNILDHREAINCGFIKSLGIMTILYGEMGSGKTKTITDMALSEEVILRDQALEIILESDMKFPNMNWATLQKSLKKRIRQHKVFSVPTVRRWLGYVYNSWQQMPENTKRIFGYDWERYGLEYNNGLEIQNVWEIIDDYACAYFIYTVQSSLLIANYSIRVDNLMQDLGNFPLWNTDFFRRDPRLMQAYSRHAHILDYDMLRLGKRMLADNPNRWAFGFGVYVISEIDKERKNSPELKDVEKTAEEANQKNDLFNMLLKMSRHACVVAHRNFVKIFVDLQRPESLGADARELGTVAWTEDAGEQTCVLPFFAPFYLFENLFKLMFKPFMKIYLQYQFMRADKTLPLYLTKNVIAWFNKICDQTNNRFGSATAKLQIQSGRMDGVMKTVKYFLSAKKIYARRYATDCLQAIFDMYAEKNTIGIDDLPEYVKDVASDLELLMQHSFFQVEVRGLKMQAA